MKKSIEEAQEESKTTLQHKVVNHLVQERPSPSQNYYPINYGQPILPGPPPIYNCKPLAMYHPNQWRQVQSQNTQISQPEASIANNNPQNNQANNSPQHQQPMPMQLYQAKEEY